LNNQASILHPDYLDITGTDGGVFHGADQAWFPGRWQRISGCGPTAAAMVTAYLARTRDGCAPLYPEGEMRQEAFAAHMSRVWQHVTPGHMGLHRPEKFSDGLAGYAARCGVTLHPHLFEVSGAGSSRPDWFACAEFVRGALARDCPVAFLNLSNGAEASLESWHWVVITALDGGQAAILDGGRARLIDLALWYQTTPKRGGLVAAV